MKNKNLVFIGGIHGVGKSIFCKKVAEKTNYIHKIASQLIREKNPKSIGKNDKKIDSIAKNQRLLIDALSKYSNEHVLLDGHFTLLTKKNKIEKISIKDFKNINPNLVVVLHEEPAIISLRRTERDGIHVLTEDLEHHQMVEIAHAQDIADSLDLPFLKLKSKEESIPVLLSYLSH